MITDPRMVRAYLCPRCDNPLTEETTLLEEPDGSLVVVCWKCPPTGTVWEEDEVDVPVL